MEKSRHTFCHLDNFLVQNPPSTCGCPTPTFHTKLSAIQETQKKGGSLCQALARQGHCVYKSICQRTKPSHTSLILNKIHLQCGSDANVHCGRTNNRFVGSESLFQGLFHFKEKLQPVKYLLKYSKCYRKLFAAALKQSSYLETQPFFLGGSLLINAGRVWDVLIASARKAQEELGLWEFSVSKQVLDPQRHLALLKEHFILWWWQKILVWGSSGDPQFWERWTRSSEGMGWEGGMYLVEGLGGRMSTLNLNREHKGKPRKELI